MKFFTPKPQSSSKTSNQPARPTFGQARAENLEHRLQKAIAERQKLARGEAAASDPVQTALKQRGQMVGRQMGRLQSELANEKNQ